MKKCMSVSILILAVMLCISFGTVFAAGAQSPKSVSKGSQSDKNVLARIGAKTITKTEFEARIAALPPQYQDALKDEKAKRNFLEMFMQAQLFSLAAKEEKIDKEPAIAMQIEDAVNGMLAQEFVRRKLSAIANPTESEIKKYYEENKVQLMKPTTVKVQHLLFKLEEKAKPEEVAAALAKAEKARKAIAGGADFDKLVKEQSDDTETKDNGGDLGYFTQQEMVPEFAEPVFKMKVGDISQPIKSPFGYHIVKLNDRKEGSTMDLNEATPTIESTLMKAKQQSALENEIHRLKKKYKVTVAADKI